MVFPRAVFWNPELAAAGVVDVVGEPAKGAFVVGGRVGEISDKLFVVPFAWDNTVETAAIWLAPGDFTTRDVASFIFAGSEFAVWSEAKPAGSAQSPGHAGECFPVRTDFQDGAIVLGEVGKSTSAREDGGAFAEVEVTFLVGLEIEGELVEAGSDEDVVIEAFVKIRLAIVVEIVKAGELVASVGVNDVVDNLKTKSLEKPAGEPAPGDLGEVTVDTLGDPNVPVPG